MYSRFLTLALFFASGLYAQKFDFRNYTTAEGLNSGACLTVFQDDDHQLWIGSTDGLNIYDGNEITSLNHKVHLPKKVVYSINKIHQKYFIGTAGGLVIYDGESSEVYHSNTDKAQDYVYCSFLDNEDRVWIGTESGLMFFEDTLKSCEEINQLQNIPIYNIVQDNHGTIWFCTKTQGVFSFANGQLKQFRFGEIGPHFVGDIQQVSDHVFLVASRSGLYEINGNKVEKLQTPLSESASYYDILKTSGGEVILSSDEGVLVYKDSQFTVINQRNGLLNNLVLKLFEDETETIWMVSPNGGLSQLLNRKLVLFDKAFIQHKGVNAIIPKNDSLFFLSTLSGVGIFNRNNGNFHVLNENKNMEFKNGIYDSKNNQLLLGTNNGIMCIQDEQPDDYKLIRGDSKIRKVFDVEMDEEGNIWATTSGGIATVKDGGLVYVDSEENISNYALVVYKSNNGVLYFGTDEGLLIYDESLKNYTKEHAFNVGRIRQITEDLEGNIWLASDEGLYKQSGNGFQKVIINTIGDEIVESICFNAKGQFWVGLKKAVLRINMMDKDTSTRAFSRIGSYMGVETNMSAILEVERHQMWFGTNEGLLQFQSDFQDELKSSSVPEINVSVSGVKNISEYLEETNKGIESYEFPYGVNQISFNAKIVNLLAAKGIHFQYRLKGVENDWKERGNNFEVLYSELPYGNFEFQVKVLSHPNLIHDDNIYSVKISIAKPFYLQTWFLLVCLVILLTWTYSYVVIKRNVQLLNKQQGIILKQKEVVEEKNKEIMDSISYAKRIQNTIIPKNTKLEAMFDEFFVLYKPRDIVSGDFYWVDKVGDWTVFAVADCTGHGVPGAMVSLMCSNLLNKVIIERKEMDPGAALDIISVLLIERLKETDDQVKDGMDIALCYWNQSTNELKYSGANNPLYIVRDNQIGITKANKQPVGFFEDKVPFDTHTVFLEQGDQIVLFSDGYKDQFGGPKNKKFGAKRFNNLLKSNYTEILSIQKETLVSNLEEWQSEEEQVDDICILSVRV